MIIIFGIVVLLAIAALVALNFYPPLKEKAHKWIVVLEGLVATATYWFGQVSDALKQAQDAGYIPSQWMGYLPYVFLAYLLIKQVQMAAADKKAAVPAK